MKKIFTLLFFAGLTAGAMAQNTRNAQYRNQNNNNQLPAYANNSQGYEHSTGVYSQPNQANNGYTPHNGYQFNEQGYNRNNENGYGNYRHFNGRNNDRRFRDNYLFDQRPYGYERKREFERYHGGWFNTRFSMRYRQPSCY